MFSVYVYNYTETLFKKSFKGIKCQHRCVWQRMLSFSLSLREHNAVKADAFDKWATKISIIILRRRYKKMNRTDIPTLMCCCLHQFFHNSMHTKSTRLHFDFTNYTHIFKRRLPHTHTNTCTRMINILSANFVYFVVHCTILACRKSRLCLCSILTYAHARTCKYKFLVIHIMMK